MSKRIIQLLILQWALLGISSVMLVAAMVAVANDPGADIRIPFFVGVLFNALSLAVLVYRLALVSGGKQP